MVNFKQEYRHYIYYHVVHIVEVDVLADFLHQLLDFGKLMVFLLVDLLKILPLANLIFPPCDDHMHKCQDYVDNPTCENKCQDGYPKTLEEDKSYASSVYTVRGEENIMKEIYENGSVEGSFEVYEDFADYESGVYQHITGENLGGHAIKIIGWGVTDDGIKYWIIANSWGTNWGEKGFFRIVRGQDECGIESVVNTGIPKL